MVPLSKAEAEDFFSAERQRGQTESVRHALRMDKSGTLRGEYCSKRYLTCDKPGKGQGEWSVDADGTLRLQVNWVSHSETRLAGKLYRHEGFLYLFDASAPAKPWIYRFEQ